MNATPLTKQQYVYIQLREAIIAGALPQGHRLVVSELAKKYSVSNIPVREALRQLEQERVIEAKPHSSFVVAKLTADEAIWASELRTVLEPLATLDSIPQLTSDDYEELNHLHLQMIDATSAMDYPSYTALNNRFHALLYHRCPNEIQKDFIVRLSEICQRYVRIWRVPEHLLQGCQEHAAILKSIRDEKPEAVAELVRLHRVRIMNDLQNAIEANESIDLQNEE